MWRPCTIYSTILLISRIYPLHFSQFFKLCSLPSPMVLNLLAPCYFHRHYHMSHIKNIYVYTRIHTYNLNTLQLDLLWRSTALPSFSLLQYFVYIVVRKIVLNTYKTAPVYSFWRKMGMFIIMTLSRESRSPRKINICLNHSLLLKLPLYNLTYASWSNICLPCRIWGQNWMTYLCVPRT